MMSIPEDANGLKRGRSLSGLANRKRRRGRDGFAKRIRRFADNPATNRLETEEF
jgi:hypothetical protein